MRLKLQPKETSNTFLFYLIFCRSISVECKLHKDRKFRLLCSLLFLQCLEQCVEHRRCSRNIYWLKEWINEWTWPKVYCDFAIDCLRKVVAGEFWTLDFAAFPSIKQCWVQSEGDLNSRRFRRMRGGGGAGEGEGGAQSALTQHGARAACPFRSHDPPVAQGHLPARARFAAAARRWGERRHRQRRRGDPLERKRCRRRLRGPGTPGSWQVGGGSHVEAAPEQRGVRGLQRAGWVAPAGPAPFSSPGRDPCPGAAPSGRAGPGGRAQHLMPGVATRRSRGGLGAGTVPGLSEPGGQGAAALRSLPSLASPPSRAGRRRPGQARFPNRKGLGQSAGRPITEVKCERPPGCGPQRLQVSPPLPTATQTPFPRGGPAWSGRHPPLPSPETRQRTPSMTSPLLPSRLPLQRRESPGRRGLANATSA